MINKDVRDFKTSIFWYRILSIELHRTQRDSDAVKQGHEGCGEIIKIGDQVQNDKFQVVSGTDDQEDQGVDGDSESCYDF